MQNVLIGYFVMCIPFWLFKTYYEYVMLTECVVLPREHDNEDTLYQRGEQIIMYNLAGDGYLGYWIVAIMCNLVESLFWIVNPSKVFDDIEKVFSGKLVNVFEEE